MKHSNPWENPLHSWTPRRPSARLKERLFGRPAAVERKQPASASAVEGPIKLWLGSKKRRSLEWPWMAPAMAVFLLGLFLSGGPGAMRESGGLGSAEAASLILGTNIQSGATLVAYLPTAVHSPHNNWQGATFEWTNEPASLTTSAPVTGTNTLFY